MKLEIKKLTISSAGDAYVFVGEITDGSNADTCVNEIVVTLKNPMGMTFEAICDGAIAAAKAHLRRC